jgi:hypothetical protein
MIHPKTEIKYINDMVGYGVFAKELIPAGTITYVKDSLEIVISQDSFDKYEPEMQAVIEKYSYMDQNGERIVSWDFAKYVNHCCNCNTMSTGYGFEMAIRDIQPGEQITDEYGIFNLDEDFPLVCAEPNCRKRVSPEDFDTFYGVWDERIKKAMTKFSSVDQPLLPLVDTETKSELDSYLADPSKYKSVYELRLKEKRIGSIASNGQGDKHDLTAKRGL